MNNTRPSNLIRMFLMCGAVGVNVSAFWGAALADQTDKKTPATPPVSSPSTPTQGDKAPAKKEDKKEESEESSVGLKVGDLAPEAALVDASDKNVKLSELIAQGPVVVVFYRGGWCPYCNKHLSEWTTKTSELKGLGAKLVAISPETPEHAEKTVEKDKLDFMVLSDTKLEAANGFKLLFSLSEEVKTKYKGYGIDLEKHNASKTWQLPHTGTFVIDAKGVVQYASADTDYKKRPSPDEAIEVLKKMHALKPDPMKK